MGTALSGMMQLMGSSLGAASQIESGARNKRANYMMAADAVQRGQYGESQARARGSQVVASATAGASGAGVDVQSGSVVDVVGGTRMMSALDAAMIRSNALREAYGYRVRGDVAMAEAGNAAVGTLLTGSGSAATSGYRSGMSSGGGSEGSNAPYLASPGTPYDTSTTPTFVRG